LSIKGSINFLQFERFGKFDEQIFRNQFEENFDFLAFNKILIKCKNITQDQGKITRKHSKT
jgi:hypothetical protein